MTLRQKEGGRLDGSRRIIADLVMADWILDGMADVCAEARGGLLDWRTHGRWKDRENEWYVQWENGTLGEIMAKWFADQQLGQMYELMQAIRKRELEENDPEQQ